MEKRALLSIIIPFYNGLDYIKRLTRSIDNSLRLSASGHKVELIIIVDSPWSNVVEIEEKIDDYKESLIIKIVRNEKNIGVANTRNIGINLAIGEYLYFIDQDDEVSDDFFEEVFKVINQADFVLLNGLLKYQYHSCKVYYLKPKLTLKNLLKDDYIRSPGQVLVRRSLLAENFRFPSPNENFGADDRFFYISLFKQLKPICIYVEKPIYIANIHSNNYSHDESESIRSSLELWEDCIQLNHFSKSEKKIIEKNKLMLRYRLEELSGSSKFLGGMEFIAYKFKPNKIIRSIARTINNFMSR